MLQPTDDRRRVTLIHLVNLLLLLRISSLVQPTRNKLELLLGGGEAAPVCGAEETERRKGVSRCVSLRQGKRTLCTHPATIGPCTTFFPAYVSAPKIASFRVLAVNICLFLRYVGGIFNARDVAKSIGAGVYTARYTHPSSNAQPGEVLSGCGC